MLSNNYDLCSDKVVLDYSELEKTAMVAVRYSLEALHQRIREWYNLKRRPTNLDAEWLLDDATALATATATLHYLEEGEKREEVIVVRDRPKPISATVGEPRPANSQS